ncbi:hypothetical protein [Paractinoplanes abujensis]|nr:hypothetical protein [Actinoplanes abujensis]
MRLLTTTGLGLLAGAALGVGPAQAADASPAAAAKSQTGRTAQADQHRDRDVVVGYYRSYRACELAGRIGERWGRWDDYDCDYQRRGFHRGSFALEVERGWGWNRPGHHWDNGHRGPRGPR